MEKHIMSMFIKEFDGLDHIPSGTLTTQFPWYQLNAPASGVITDDAGAFPLSKGLVFSAGTSLVQANAMAFPGNSLLMRNNTTPNGKSIHGVGMWFKATDTAANYNPIALISLGTSYSTSAIPLIGVRNSPADGFKLCFATNLTTFTNAPVMVDLQLNTYYWIYMKFSLTPNAQLVGSYYINNIPIEENFVMTLTSDPLSTYPCNRLVFSSNSTNVKYMVDDVYVQSVSGADTDWPAGFTGDVPNDPVLADFSVITSRRVKSIPIVADGDVIEFTPSDPLMENWEAAISDTEYVQSTERGQTDVYKVDPSAVALRDVNAVKFQAKTNTYFSLTSAIKDGSNPVDDGVGVINRGGDKISYILEKDANDQDWTNVTITDTQFGLKSL